MQWVTRKFVAFLIAIGFLGVASAQVPIVEKEMPWQVSYETVAFETEDGDLGVDQYAKKREGEWYIRKVPKNRGQFTATTSPEAIQGKTEVPIRAMKTPENQECIGCAYYAEFASRKGHTVRVPMSKTAYDRMGTESGAPQPSRTERVPLTDTDEADAAIAFDDSSNSGNQSDISSFSWNHTTSGSDRLLFVSVSMEDSGDDDRTVTDLTYDGVSLTSIRADDNSGDNITTSIWYLTAPNTGTNSVSVTLAGQNFNAVGIGISLTGVDQTTPLDADAGETNSNVTTQTTSITTATDDAWVVDTAAQTGDGNFDSINPQETGQTLAERVDWQTSSVNEVGGSYKGPISSAGSTNMGWSDGGSSDWAHSVAAFAPATDDGGAVRTQRVITY